MFLKNIRLVNFKCHEDLFLDFSTGNDKNPVRKTTFLTGENGSGKSAVLQAIALVTGGSEALFSIPGLPDDFITAGRSFCEISATITTAQGEERHLGLRLERGQSRFAITLAARNTLAAMDAALRHTSRSYFAAGYGSGRQLDSPDLVAAWRDLRSPRYAAVHSLFSPASLLRAPDESAAETDADTLREALNTFLPKEVRFLHRHRDTGQLLFQTPNGVLPLSLLSNGYKQTVAWVSDLLHHIRRVFGDYKNPLAARGLLLIDEIDLHLHPAWQLQLHAFFAKGLPNFQLIATSCAPLTLAGAAEGDIVVLRVPEGAQAVTDAPADAAPGPLLPGEAPALPGERPFRPGRGRRAAA